MQKKTKGITYENHEIDPKVLERYHRNMSNAQPNDHIGRVVAKLLKQYERECLSQAVLDSVDYERCEPSTLPFGDCFKIYNQYIKEECVKKHPGTRLEAILETDNVTVTPTVAIVHEENGDRTIPSMLGYVTEDPVEVDQAIFSDILSYCTSVHNETRSSSIVNIFDDDRIQAVIDFNFDLTDIRSIVADQTRSPNIAREKIYAWCRANRVLNLVLQDEMIGKLPHDAVVNPRIKEIIDRAVEQANVALVRGGQKPIKANIAGYQFDAHRYDVKFAKERLSPVLLHTIRNVIEGRIGSEGGKRGFMLSGYNGIECSKSLNKCIVRAREILAVLKLTKFDIIEVTAGSKVFTPNMCNILAHNETFVVHPSGEGVLTRDSYVKNKYGVYAHSNFGRIIIKPDLFGNVEYSRKGITFPSVEKCTEVLSFLGGRQGELWMSLVSYTPFVEKQLIDKKLFFFPVFAPHSCKIWVTNFDCALEFDKITQMNRMLHAIYYRMTYPFTRYPFCAADSMVDKIKLSLFLPKLVRRTLLDSQYKIRVENVVTVSEDREIDFSDYVSNRIVVEDKKIAPVLSRKAMVMSTLNNKEDDEKSEFLFGVYRNDQEIFDYLYGEFSDQSMEKKIMDSIIQAHRPNSAPARAAVVVPPVPASVPGNVDDDGVDITALNNLVAGARVAKVVKGKKENETLV